MTTPNEARRQRIDELRRKIAEVTGEELISGMMPDCPPELEERFLERVLAFEMIEPTPLFDQLIERGVELPEPRDLSDEQIAEKLHELFGALAQLGVYVTSTDHLDDRALYEILWRDTLRVPEMTDPDDPTLACMIDLIMGFSEQDIATWLSYYASDQDRDAWQADFPDLDLPPKKKRVCDRDRTLPIWQPSAPQAPSED